VEAQDVQRPAHVAFVEGAALLERDGQVLQAQAGVPFLAGDRVRTTAGRVEIVFPDGSVLDIDEYSTADAQSSTLLRLITGRALLTVSGAADPSTVVRYHIDTPAASVSTGGAGEYRVALYFDATGSEAELAVLRGTASLITEQGSIAVGAGERSLARENEAPGVPQPFNSARYDAFDRWAATRRDARLATASARYLPNELRMYSGTFDRYGAWQYQAPYGYVWYPTVPLTWRPYYDGYWWSYPRYGWTWIGGGAWGWPTHHYGRWGHASGGWYWIPGARWGPAWVSWAAAPGYVSWCALGFDNRPVFGFSAGFATAWPGWVVVPRTYFHHGWHGRHVGRHAVAPHHLPRSTPFVVEASAPVAPPRAIPRPGAVPRVGAAVASSPRYEIRGDRLGVAVPRPPTGRSDLSTASQLRSQRASTTAPDTIRPTDSASRDRIFRQALPEVRRAAPRDSRVAQPPTVLDRRRSADVRAYRPPVPGAAQTANPGSPSRDRDPRAVPRWNASVTPGPADADTRWSMPGAAYPGARSPALPSPRPPEPQPPPGASARTPRWQSAPAPGSPRTAVPRSSAPGRPAEGARSQPSSQGGPSPGVPSRAAPQRSAPSGNAAPRSRSR
jgi:hypothetical protein